MAIRVGRVAGRCRTAVLLVVVTAAHIALFVTLAYQWRQVVPRWRSWDDVASLDAILMPQDAVAPLERDSSKGDDGGQRSLRPMQPKGRSAAAQPSAEAVERSVETAHSPAAPAEPSGQAAALDTRTIGSILRRRTGCRRDAMAPEERERCEQQLGALGKELPPVEGADIPLHVRQGFDQAWKDNHTSQFVRLGCFARFGQGKFVTYKTTRGVNFGPCFFATTKGNLVPNKPRPKGF